MMPDPTLTLQYTDLVNAISRQQGLGDTFSSLDATNQARVDFAVQSGYRYFLYHPQIGGRVHRWSFLRPTTSITVWGTLDGQLFGAPSYSLITLKSTLTIKTGGDVFYPSCEGQTINLTNAVGVTTGYVITDYLTSTTVKVNGDLSALYAADNVWAISSSGNFLMPSNYGAIEGTFTFGATTGYLALSIVGENQIRDLRQTGTSGGLPQHVAIIPVANDGTVAQRFWLQVWPTPDSAYALTYRYHAMMHKLSAGAPYPLGGAQHSQTVLASCMAQAELLFNDEKGIHWDRYMELLAASVQMDLTDHAPEKLGYNSDNSDGECSYPWRGRASSLYYGSSKLW